jgi:hypothetical protein
MCTGKVGSVFFCCFGVMRGEERFLVRCSDLHAFDDRQMPVPLGECETMKSEKGWMVVQFCLNFRSHFCKNKLLSTIIRSCAELRIIVRNLKLQFSTERKRNKTYFLNIDFKKSIIISKIPSSQNSSSQITRKNHIFSKSFVSKLLHNVKHFNPQYLFSQISSFNTILIKYNLSII